MDEHPEKKEQRVNWHLAIAVFFSLGLVAYAVMRVDAPAGESAFERKPPEGRSEVSFRIPLGRQGLFSDLVKTGALDRDAFQSLYKSRGGFSDAEQTLIAEFDRGEISITEKNSGLLLNVLWAFGLANTNPILEEGPMRDARYGGAGNFASTGGWGLAKGNAMDHYGKHPLVVLTGDQQLLVERASKNIFRPCCGNPAHFPDCNHGMAMLGALQILAAQGANEETLYRAALKLNAMWFPEQYANIERYAAARSMTLDAKRILGAEFSSASGYQRLLAELPSNGRQATGGCGLEEPSPVERSTSCGN